MFTETLVLLVTLQSVLGQLYGHVEWIPKGNESSPECYQEQDIGISLTEVWTYTEDDDYDGCQDCKGNAYMEEESITVCGGCLRYTCKEYECEEPVQGELKKVRKYFWSQAELHSACCSDFSDRVVPPGGEIGCRSLKDPCKTKECLTCRTKPGDKDSPPTGYLQASYRITECCLDQNGLHPLDHVAKDHELCNHKVCMKGHPAYWEQLEHYGTHGCCMLEDKMYKPGDKVDVKGKCLTCSDGNMVSCVCNNGTYIVEEDQLDQLPSTTTTTTTTSTTTTTTTTKTPFCDASLQIVVRSSKDNSDIGASVKKLTVSSLTGASPDISLAGSPEIPPVPLTQNGLYSVEAWADGYITAIDEIVVDCDISQCEKCKPAITVFLTPNIEYGKVQVVMSWGERPQDLDIHALIQSPDGSGESCHVFYARRDCESATLDTDNASGGLNGAETITIHDVDNQIGKIYMIYIHKFTGQASEFIASDARVSIMDGIHTTSTYLREEEFGNEEYFVAGCLRILGHHGNHPLYQWAPVKRFFSNSPDLDQPDLCIKEFEDVPNFF